MEDVDFRNIQEEDLEMLRNWRNSETISKYMFTNKHISAEDQMNWYRKISDDVSSHYWIVVCQTEPIGFASLVPAEKADDTYEFGLYLGNPYFKNMGGYGSKTLYHILSYAFEKLYAHKVCCEVLAFNDKAIRLYRKFGLKEQGYFKDFLRRDNERIDCIAFAIFEQEWRDARNDLYKVIYKS